MKGIHAGMARLPSALGILCATVCCSAIPQLDPGVRLTSNAAFLQVNSCSTPSVIDWNNDGRKDLLTGQFIDGYVSVFLNQGTDAQPAFGDRTFIQANGSTMSTSYG